MNQFISLPFSVYKTFKIEQKYGFNKTTPQTFVTDRIKALILNFVLIAVVVPCILYVVDIGGDKLVFNLASLSIGFIVLINILVPILVIPCFFTFSELEQGNLKSAIFDEARKTNVRVSEIKVIDGSKRSSHSNAFVTGFWKWRKVVIFDTLIE